MSLKNNKSIKTFLYFQKKRIEKKEKIESMNEYSGIPML